MFRTIFFCLLLSSIAWAETSLKSSTSFETLHFLKNREEHSINHQENLELDLEFKHDNEKNFLLFIKPRLYLDFADFSRNRYIPNESYLMYYTDHVELTAGLQIKNWGVSRSYNPTDSLNRYDFERNFYTPPKLGELMISAKGSWDNIGPFTELSIEGIFLPLFQEAPLPDLENRFGFEGEYGIFHYELLDDSFSLSPKEEIAGALQFSATVKNIDFSLMSYHGPEKNPAYRLGIEENEGLRVRPVYYRIDRMGANFEASFKELILHFEAAATFPQGSKKHGVAFEEEESIPGNYFQFVPGFDYTFHQFAGGDLTLVVEYHIEANPEYNLQNFRPFQNDLFVGWRYEFLDKRDSRIEFGMFKDMGNQELLLSSEFSTRLYKELKFFAGGLLVAKDEERTPLSVMDNNSYVYSKLSYSWGKVFKKNETPDP